MGNMKHLENQLSCGGSPKRESLFSTSQHGDLSILVAAQGRCYSISIKTGFCSLGNRNIQNIKNILIPEDSSHPIDEKDRGIPPSKFQLPWINMSIHSP